MTAPRLGIIGAGNMAEAFARGLLAAGAFAPDEILACDPAEERRAVFAALGARTGTDNAAAAACGAVLLSVKPQAFAAVIGAAGAAMGPGTLAVSIAAGVRTERIAALLPDGVRIVRAMPNTPMLAGRGATGVAAGPHATPADLETVRAWFACAGTARIVPEAMIDAVTAVSGSGPAYVFRFAEALAAAGVEAGLPPEIASEFAVETLIGSGRLLERGLATGEDAATLRRKVTSPGGTTEAALRAFDAAGFERIVCAAVAAARSRAVELARGS